jgi:hypothetical protein
VKRPKDFGGGVACVAKGAERESVVALGEADAVLVAQQSGVEAAWPRWRRPVGDGARRPV